ncbi:MAG: hypothetical protein IGS38_09065 [Synechococcales cyanobacterium M58_A2018_015]|nr:hypothetical protein [Synechococcales cyanobacterium M58_A2018_015]
MYDLAHFSEDDMYNCALALRNMDRGAKNIEDVANRIIRYLYDHLIDVQTGQSACALVRFFMTCPYMELSDELRLAARGIVNGRSILSNTKCLTLMATAGDQAEWNSRQMSQGHQAIPLIDKEFVSRAPMISQLIHQFGLDVNTVLDPDPELLVDLEQTTFNVFYVPDALGSPHIPAQKEFVIPFQIKSVLGFGGMLPSGNLFAIILFAKTRISPEVAELFKWISAYARISVAALDKRAVFIS